MKLILLFISICISTLVFGQSTDYISKGNVSFISSEHVYVQFVNTGGIQIGDTLFLLQNKIYMPVLIVKNLSTISCACVPVGNILLSVTNQVLAKIKIDITPVFIPEKKKESLSVNDLAIANAINNKDELNKKPLIDGRISLSSYLNNTSDSTINISNRLNLSLKLPHIYNSKFSAECYVLLNNKNLNKLDNQLVLDTSNNIDSINKSVNLKQTTNELKIYNLSLKYDLDSTTSFIIGRKININMANIGAVDGLQVEKMIKKNIIIGALVGSRPDYSNYNINPSLLQYGAFAAYKTQKESDFTQTSLAFFNQFNHRKTDRRFAYLQHSNNLLKKVDLFCSLEIDFFGAKMRQDSKITKNSLGNDSTIYWYNRTPVNMFDLTSAYVSLRFRPLKNLLMSLSYDARKNIYYYETFKNIIDSILDKETRQGMRFQFNYRPLKLFTWGGNFGYRSQPSDSVPALNGNTYLYFPQVPFINVSANISATVLNSNYVHGIIYGISMSTDIVEGKIFSELEYRNVNYKFKYDLIPLHENIAELSLSWIVNKKLIISTHFEGTIDSNNNLKGRLFFNISKRF